MTDLDTGLTSDDLRARRSGTTYAATPRTSLLRAPAPRKPMETRQPLEPRPADSGPPGQRAAKASEARGLWSLLPAQMGERFRPHVDALARAMLKEIQKAVPEYAQPLEGPFGATITQGVRGAILQCVDSVVATEGARDTWTTVFRNLGKVEFNEGRSLDCLQTAYRVGGRVAWRHVSEFGQSIGLSSDALCLCAEAIFAYVDEISALSIEGYTAAQTRAAGTIARRRRRLLELVLADPPASPQTIAAQAVSAQWNLPAEVTVVALEPRTDQHSLATPDLHGEVLVDLEGNEPCLVTGDPARQLKDLEGRLRGWRAVVGPTVRLTDAARSLAWARRTMRLVQRGVIADAPITWCADHLSTLWLLTDEFLVKELCTRALAPFDDLTTKQRARLGETLLIWLQSRGSAPEIAKKLKVHPQTVRYRMHQLTDLFGDRLNNADDRLDMEIALRAEALLADE
ncbi:helix-turn-helix domain-containing protein [Amycolatopsis sp. H20-H5]|uniref:PucR family transcriptional regulator n=1 Tax=Amycolatopsis sp. H20-H5 TaxID=3046309 RepID=UPI002DBDEE39|nr:helix-turn-helix domain-containing protein [Amycolatopsis sp. H20-H5]MEC3978418.1 helix-turn-helix domain-containing protein [Amycolatopsis sp. H20-H5]